MNIQDSKSCTSFYFSSLYNVKTVYLRGVFNVASARNKFPTPATQILALCWTRLRLTLPTFHSSVSMSNMTVSKCLVSEIP